MEDMSSTSNVTEDDDKSRYFNADLSAKQRKLASKEAAVRAEVAKIQNTVNKSLLKDQLHTAASLDQLNATHNMLKQTIEKRSSELSRLEKSIKNLSNTVQSVETLTSDAAAIQAHSNDYVNDLAQRIQLLKMDDANRTKTFVENVNDTVNKWKERFTMKSFSIQNHLQNTIASLVAKVEKNERDVQLLDEDLRRQFEIVKQQDDDLNGENENIERAIVGFEADKEKIKNYLNDIKERISKGQQDDITPLRKPIELSDVNLVSMYQQIDDLYTSLVELMKTNHEYSLEIDDKNNDIGAITIEIDRMNCQLEDWKKELDNKNEMDLTNDELDALRNEVKRDIDNEKALSEQLKKMLGEEYDKNSQNQKMQIVETTKEIDNVKEQIIQLKSVVMEYEQKLSNINAHLQKLDAEEEQSNAKNEALESSLRELRNTRDQMKIDVDQASIKHQQLQSEIASLTSGKDLAVAKRTNINEPPDAVVNVVTPVTHPHQMTTPSSVADNNPRALPVRKDIKNGNKITRQSWMDALEKLSPSPMKPNRVMCMTVDKAEVKKNKGDNLEMDIKECVDPLLYPEGFRNKNILNQFATEKSIETNSDQMTKRKYPSPPDDFSAPLSDDEHENVQDFTQCSPNSASEFSESDTCEVMSWSFIN